MTAELIPIYDNAKSFYGKAKVITTGGETMLKSYNTLVCAINANGEFEKLWNGYSATTMRHINEFVRQYGINGGGKKWWESLPVDDSNIVVDIAKAVA